MDGQVFTKETKDLIVEVVVDLAKDKVSWYIKPFVKPAVKMAIDFVDLKADKIIPDKVDKLINEMITSALNGNFDKATVAASKASSQLIQLEKVESGVVQEAIVAVLKLIVALIKGWIEGKK